MKKQWFEAAGSRLDKVGLARHLGGLPKDDIPPGIAGALRAAATHFEARGGVASTAPDATPAGGRDNGGG